MERLVNEQAAGDAAATNGAVVATNADTISELRRLVAGYHEVDDRLKQLRAASNLLRQEKQSLSQQICGIMHGLGLSDIKYKDSMLRYTCREITRPPTLKIVRNRLLSLIPDAREQERTLKELLAPCGKEERVSIRMVRVK